MTRDPIADTVERLMDMLRRYELESLDVSEAGLRVRVRAPGPPPPPTSAPDEDRYRLWRSPIWPLEPPRAAPTATPERPPTASPVLAPVTGTFYGAPKPDQPAFVEAGDTVEVGQVIGLIEAMKVFSEIHADVAGIVVEISVRNGSLVQHGDVLLYVDSAPQG